MRLMLGGAAVDVLVYGRSPTIDVPSSTVGSTARMTGSWPSSRPWLVECEALDRPTDLKVDFEHSGSWQTADVRVPWNHEAEVASTKFLADALTRLVNKLH